ncbi:hypothetical protein V8D89_008392 [Ganoderma adspersum]
MPNPIKSDFCNSDRSLRASMTNLVSEIEKWEAHLSVFLSTFAYGSGDLSVISRQGHIYHLDALGDIIQDMCSIFNASFVRAASTVRHQRNSLAQINFLPDEILLPIFLEATHNHPHRKINILLTCSRWRDVCASDSSFWGRFLVPSSVRHARRAVAAAQGRPLDLTIDFKTWSKDLQDVVSQRESTVRCLTARRVSLASKETMGWLMSSFPHLREIGVESGTAYTWGDCVLLPSNSPRSEPYETVFLSFHLIPRPPVLQKEDSLYDNHLLSALRACPLLEYLTLCHPPMSTHEALAAPPPCPVSLPMLRHLVLRIHAQKAASFLEAIETSPETLYSVDIELTDMKHWAGHERPWHKPLLVAPLTPFSSVPAHSLPMLGRLESIAMHHGRSVVGRGPLRLRPSGQHAPANFRLTFSELKSLDDVAMPAAFHDFLAFLVARNFLDNVTRLRLEAFPSSEHALRIIRAAPHVTTLAAHAGSVADEKMPVDVLKDIARTHRHSPYPISPKLEAVALVGCTIDAWTLADLGEALGSLDLRVLSLERCDSELEAEDIIARLQGTGSGKVLVNDGLDVRWVEDGPRYELRI